MTSRTIGFPLTAWHEFSLDFKDALRWDLPDGPGIYALRSECGAIPRFRGASDILYFGCTKNVLSGLRGRIMQYFSPSAGQQTNERIYGVLTKRDLPMAISFTECQRPRHHEMKLLERFTKQHWELPPLNRAG